MLKIETEKDIIVNIWLKRSRHPCDFRSSSVGSLLVGLANRGINDIPSAIESYGSDISSDITHDLPQAQIRDVYKKTYSSKTVEKVDTDLFKETIVLNPCVKDRNFIKTACLAVINHCLTQLTLLGLSYSPLVDDGDIEPREIIYRSLEDRYKFEKPIDYGKTVLDSKYTNIHKLLKDIKTITCVLEEARDEIDVFGCDTTLGTYIDVQKRMNKDEEEFLKEVSKKRKLLDDLKKTYNKLRFEGSNECKELNKMRTLVFGKMKNTYEIARAEVTLTQNWENARQEQNTIILRNDEQSYKNITNDMKRQIFLEDSVHGQIEKYLNEAKDDDYQEIENWMEYYDREVEERDMDILRLKHRIDLLIVDKETLQNSYQRRTEEMESWIAYKKKQKEDAIKLRLQNRAARKIQIWWREVMIRKKLGPYRKKRRNKDKGKRTSTKSKLRK